MANPIIKIKRGTTTPVSLSTGELAVDLQNQNLFVGDASGVPITIGGSGTFATKAYADAAVAALGSSGGAALTQEISDRIAGDDALDLRADELESKTQNIDLTGTSAGTTKINGGVEIAEWASFAGSTTYILNNGDLEFSNAGIGGGMVLGLRWPSNGTDATHKNYVDSAISALGSVFHYVGDVSAATGNDLDTLSDTTTGAYYRVDVAGTYTASGFSAAAKAGDAFVRTTSGWQKLDNVDAVVSGTANEISVSGDENAGYTVSIDPIFSGRVSTAETEIDGLQSKTQNIDLAGTTAGVTKVNGELSVVDLTATGATNIYSIYAEGAATFNSGATISNGNLVGNGTNEITDFVIDGGVY